MTPNTGPARLRKWDQEKDKCAVCLNCKLPRCVLDEPGQSNSTRCPLNRKRAKRKKQGTLNNAII